MRIFSKKEISELPPYYKGVNLKINLEEGKELLFSPLYYLLLPIGVSYNS
jgi:hypothetical protein